MWLVPEPEEHKGPSPPRHTPPYEPWGGTESYGIDIVPALARYTNLSHANRVGPALLPVDAPRHGVGPVGRRPGLQDRRQNVRRAGPGTGQGMAVFQVFPGRVRRVSRAPQHYSRPVL